jgi:dTDP-4-dehydrorhamnose reductase
MALVPLLTTGVSGLVGSRFAELFSHQYQIDNLDISHPTRPIDITDPHAVNSVISTSPAEVLIHFAAFTDVTRAWEERGDTTGLAYRINVTGTKNLLAACAAAGKHFIHISTAYVFDGKKNGLYTEENTPNPIEWYGTTKALAEAAVQESNVPWTILRIDQPFRPDPFNRPDIVHRIIAGLQNDSLPPQFTDHYFGPTFIDDFSLVLDWAVRTRTPGLFHASSGEQWTDFNFATAVQKALQLTGTVKQGSLDSYLATLSRPYQRNTALSNQKLRAVSQLKLHDIHTALQQVTM